MHKHKIKLLQNFGDIPFAILRTQNSDQRNAKSDFGAYRIRRHDVKVVTNIVDNIINQTVHVIIRFASLHHVSNVNLMT